MDLLQKTAAILCTRREDTRQKLPSDVEPGGLKFGQYTSKLDQLEALVLKELLKLLDQVEPKLGDSRRR